MPSAERRQRETVKADHNGAALQIRRKSDSVGARRIVGSNNGLAQGDLTVDARQIDFASIDAREANDLIDRRTFSWTDLFNRFEATLPDDVRITTVRPSIQNEGFGLRIGVIARTPDDINMFLENLDATGAFRNTFSAEEHTDEQNQLNATLECVYLPEVGHATGNRRVTRPQR